MIQTKLEGGTTDRAVGRSSTAPAKHEGILLVCAALALAIPCVWQRHIEAMDLPSHVYNAWLASLIAHGEISGVKLVHPLTNVLGDWILSAGLSAFGPAWAARIVCIIAVEAFFWGMFALASAVSGRRVWAIVPFLAMLAYSVVFYFGFLTFYLATACSVWMLAVSWRFSRSRLWIACALAGLGFLASPLPVAWAICMIGYIYLARSISRWANVVLLVTGAGCLFVVRSAVMKLFLCHPSQAHADLFSFLRIIGALEFDPFQMQYLFLAAGVMLLGTAVFLVRVTDPTERFGPLAQLWLLNAFAFVALPSRIRFPVYGADLWFIQERIAFFLVIIFFAWAAKAMRGKGFTALCSLVALVYFVLLFVDQRALNRADEEIGFLVAQLPPRQKVVSSIHDEGARVNGLEHILDWACIGRCFDYANYEPSSLQFRVQTTGPNEVAAWVNGTAVEIEAKEHIVTAEEAPLYSVCPSSVPGRRFALRKLEAGEKTCSFSLPVTPALGRLFR